MTPAERLKQIENIYETYPRSVVSKEMEWLINRVKVLTDALETIVNNENQHNKNRTAIARAALLEDK